MADDTKNDEGQEEPEDQFGTPGDEEDQGEEKDQEGLGNLPPLSDFDSKDSESDGDLPPMEDEGDEERDDTSPLSGLPPIIDIKVDTPAVRPSDLDTPKDRATPTPTGGPRSTPRGDDADVSFESPGEGLDTPEPTSGLGFQDFAADSDFSPETPEIGPGPDSDIETPMFDSAFGGDSDEFGTGDTGTPAPTQAMETPMFESEGIDSGGDFGFDQDAFGVQTPAGGEGAAEMGTPIPDFSPDTGVPQETPRQVTVKKRSVLSTILLGIVLLIVGVLVGVAARPFTEAFVSFLPNPMRDEVEDLEGQVSNLQAQLARVSRIQEEEQTQLTEEELENLISAFEEYQQRNAELQESISQLEQALFQAEQDLRDINTDIDIANNEYITLQEQLEELRNEYTVTQSRHEGLLAENDRLTEMVGALEEANARRIASRDTLLHNLDLLQIQVEGGSPLTPQRYARTSRMNRVKDLRAKVQDSNWVTPALLDEYTDLYLSELDIAASREYFFARIPVYDRLGVQRMKWAECLMNGNWSVYFRTLDGQNVGIYENVAGSGPSDYQFREDLPSGVKSDIESEIRAMRVQDFDEKVAVLMAKEEIWENRTPFQQTFDSIQ